VFSLLCLGGGGGGVDTHPPHDPFSPLRKENIPNWAQFEIKSQDENSTYTGPTKKKDQKKRGTQTASLT
jgi:hypothetical protein